MPLFQTPRFQNCGISSNAKPLRSSGTVHDRDLALAKSNSINISGISHTLRFRKDGLSPQIPSPILRIAASRLGARGFSENTMSVHGGKTRKPISGQVFQTETVPKIEINNFDSSDCQILPCVPLGSAGTTDSKRFNHAFLTD